MGASKAKVVLYVLSRIDGDVAKPKLISLARRLHQ
jgi:hypothetical protein